MSFIPDWVRNIDKILMRTRATPAQKVILVAIAIVDEVQWVLMFEQAQQLFCLLPQDEELREGNTLEIPFDHMIELAQNHGTCVNRKKARALAKGLVVEGWEPRTYVMVGPDKEGYSHGFKMTELVAWGKKQIEAFKQQLKEQTDAAQPQNHAQTSAACEPGELQDPAKDSPPPAEAAG